MSKDLEHLGWLSIGFYVYAGLIALFSCLPFIHVFLGIGMLAGGFNEGPNPPPPALGLVFVGIGSVFILFGFSLATCIFLAGRFLKQQKKYTFCFVMAVISCMFAPLGTVLGVFTIIVLLRDSVKPLFEKKNFSQFDNPPSWR